MNTYNLSSALDKNKAFIIQKSELEKRLDPFYYVPELVDLEKKVLAHKPKRLRDYVQYMASGATPRKTESDLYYSDAENGVPFIRVQNLSPTGELDFDDCKYINHKTHSEYLKRSRVFENDLLVKITGVGRMAVSSVAPAGFEGNINQHIVVFKTENKGLSETIAAFLNSDIGERLASRRSTGGTRPALDYPAILSIPVIIEPKIFEITRKIVEIKKTNDACAQQLLDSIDGYLLNELGITLPAPPANTLKNRMFTTTIKNISGNRFDPVFHRISFKKLIESIINSKYPSKRNKEILDFIDYGLMPTQDYAFSKEDGLAMVRVTNITRDGYIDMSDIKYIKFDTPKLYDKIIKENDLLMVQCGNTTGKCSLVTKEFEGLTYGSFSFLIRGDKNIVRQDYLWHVYNSKIIQDQLNRTMTVASVRPNTSKPDVLNFIVPIPPIHKQQEIAEHINAIRLQAQNLRKQTQLALQKANEEIERIILGGN